MSKGHYEITTGNEKEPTDDAKKPDWKHRDARAQEALVIRMHEEALSHILSCESAFEMWTKLENLYERKSKVNVHSLHEQFYNVKFEGDVNDFISAITNLRAKIKQQGEDISEQMVMTKIIMALPERFRYFRSAWESVSKDDQTLENLSTRLLMEEDRQ